MKVALVMPLGETRGGAERMLMNLLVASKACDTVEYSVAFQQAGPLVQQVSDMGYKTTVIEAGRLRNPAAFGRASRELGVWLDGERPDAVLSWAAKSHLYIALGARRRGIPSAWFLHAIPDGHWMDRLTTLLPADVVLCCSTAAATAQQRLRPERPTRVVNISVDLRDFDPESLPVAEDARAALGLPPDGPLVVMVARLQRWKGVHVLVDAAHRLRSSWPDAHFVVVGGDHAMEPGYREDLESQIKALGLHETFRLVGLQQNVPLWMQAADVIVHASFDEPAGAVILEGMALGKAVVAARTAGPMEFIDDGVHGLLAEAGNPQELASAIDRLLAAPELRDRLGEAGRIRARDFGADRFAERIRDAVAGIAARAAR